MCVKEGLKNNSNISPEYIRSALKTIHVHVYKDNNLYEHLLLIIIMMKYINQLKIEEKWIWKLKSVNVVHMISSIDVLDVVSRSRDRPLLVRGTRGETHRALREEARTRGGRGQQRGATCPQGFRTGGQQPQKQGQLWESAGQGGQGLVTMTASPTPFI